MMHDRRRLLACLPAVLAPAPALAFRLEAPAAGLARDYAEACPAQAAHETLQREVEARLDGRPLPPAAVPRFSELTRCPFCGCSAFGAVDHGERTPAPGG